MTDIDLYSWLLSSIKADILQRQYIVWRNINRTLLQLYRDIGQKLSTLQKSEGTTIIQQLSKDLSLSLRWARGFSADNLWRMKKFYEIYSRNDTLAPLVQQVSRSNNIVIMEKCNDDYERKFYLKLCIKQACSKRILSNKIASKEYERYITVHETNNFLSIEESSIHEKASHILKEKYIFDFLTLGKKFSEQELETQLLEKLKNFLVELWLWFAYMWNQFEVRIEKESYFLDMLFYHTKLKCYIVIELKIWEFKPEYAWKMNFYVNAIDRKLKDASDNNTIWLLLCKEKKETIVEIAFAWMQTPLAVSEYSFTSKEISQELKNNFPSPDVLKKILEDM